MKKLFYIFLIFCIASCNDNDIEFEESVNLPLVEMKETTNIDETGVTLNAFVHHLGTENIIRSSFNWYLKGKQYNIEDDRFLIDVELQKYEALNVRIDRDLIKGYDYEGRFIIELEDKKMYSNTISFFSQGAKFEPIQLESAGIIDNPIFSGLDKIFNPRGSISANSITEGQIFAYQEDQQFWAEISSEFNALVLDGIFQSDHNSILSIGKSSYNSAEEVGLWRLDDFNSNFERLGDISYSFFPEKFSFVFGDICYSNSADWDLVSFNVENYQGVNILDPIPFVNIPTDDASRYHAMQVNNEGYIFFSSPSTGSDGPFHPNQFWKFNPSNLEWSQLPEFPGTGRDLFAVSTDSEKYIYVGLGSKNYDQPYTIEGDIWRFNIVENIWELIGWAPNVPWYHPFVNAIEKNGKNYLPASYDNKLVFITIDANKIQPF